MAITYLPPEDHVLRHVSSQRLRRDDDDNVVGCLPHAFQRRETDETLSVTWLEHFEGERPKKLSFAIAAMRKELDVSPRSGFALANVGRIQAICESSNHKVRIIHEPTELNPAHSEIRRLPRDEIDLLELLASDAVIEVLPAAQFPAAVNKTISG
jgi:hypothetical protein